MNYLQKKKQAIIMMLAAQIIKTAQGYPLTINDCESGTAVDYTVWGNSVQDGTPTPESPVEIQSVGDLTKNLLPYPYYNTTRTVNGVTWTDNGDGTITASGTATDYTSFSIVYKKQGVIQPNKEYVFSHNGTDTKNISVDIILYDKDGKSTRFITSNSSFTIAENEELITINLKRSVSGYSVGGTFKPQLELGSTATEYEPYGYKIPIVNSGKNLIPYPYSQTTKTENGITFTDNGDGSVTVSGTATEYVAFNFVQALPCRPNQAYTIVKNGVDVNNVSFVFCDVNENGKITRETVSTTIEKTFTVTTLASTAYIKLLMKRQNNAKCTGTVKPTLELGETATEYEPYRVPVTANIYLDEPLKKGESINFGADNLPGLQLFEGSNVITANTVVKPEKIVIDYYEKG